MMNRAINQVEHYFEAIFEKRPGILQLFNGYQKNDNIFNKLTEVRDRFVFDDNDLDFFHACFPLARMVKYLTQNATLDNTMCNVELLHVQREFFSIYKALKDLDTFKSVNLGLSLEKKAKDEIIVDESAEKDSFEFNGNHYITKIKSLPESPQTLKLTGVSIEVFKSIIENTVTEWIFGDEKKFYELSEDEVKILDSLINEALEDANKKPGRPKTNYYTKLFIDGLLNYISDHNLLFSESTRYKYLFIGVLLQKLELFNESLSYDQCGDKVKDIIKNN